MYLDFNKKYLIDRLINKILLSTKFAKELRVYYFVYLKTNLHANVCPCMKIILEQFYLC